jgi:TetR/AcrR family transcriptional regulator, regulator of autoinduction and epiphytic fitness
VGAARTLFADRGYARTTITDIAAAAGVAPQTVYWAFGSKATLVREIREAWLAEAQTGGRLQAVLLEQVPTERLAAFAAFMTHQWATGSTAVAIQQEAMRVDPAVALDVAETLARRATALSRVTEPLGAYLRPGLTVAGAHDQLLALSMVEVYMELRGRGWTDDRYRDWLREILQWQLLESPAPRG